MNGPNGSTNGRNGLFLKLVVGGLVAGIVAAGGGLMKLYRDVGVLQVGSGLERRVERLENLLQEVASDRDKRTIILQGIEARLQRLEARR